MHIPAMAAPRARQSTTMAFGIAALAILTCVLNAVNDSPISMHSLLFYANLTKKIANYFIHFQYFF
jgi:hypothetical protein